MQFACCILRSLSIQLPRLVWPSSRHSVVFHNFNPQIFKRPNIQILIPIFAPSNDNHPAQRNDRITQQQIFFLLYSDHVEEIIVDTRFRNRVTVFPNKCRPLAADERRGNVAGWIALRKKEKHASLRVPSFSLSPSRKRNSNGITCRQMGRDDFSRCR